MLVLASVDGHFEYHMVLRAEGVSHYDDNECHYSPMCKVLFGGSKDCGTQGSLAIDQPDIGDGIARSLQRGELRVQLCGCAIRSPSRALIALTMSEIARSAATMASSGATLVVPSSRTVNPLPMMERARLSFSPALRRQASTMSSLPA